MDATMDILPGEGEIRTTTEKQLRYECDVCGEPAHFKHTFLLENARIDPLSSAYRKDDCSWCEDACRYVCKEHQNDREPPSIDLFWCSTFPATERFKHLFLYWKKVK